MNNKTKYRIGIDPDLKKSGIAVIAQEPFNSKKIVELKTLPFFDTVDLLKEYQEKGEVLVCLEAGWLNATKNYHAAFNKRVAGRIGANVGENHAVGKLMEEFLKKHKIPFQLIKPTSKKWDARIFKLITKFEGKSNSEMRDAARAAWN